MKHPTHQKSPVFRFLGRDVDGTCFRTPTSAIPRIVDWLQKQKFGELFPAVEVGEGVGIASRTVRDYTHALTKLGCCTRRGNTVVYGSKKTIDALNTLPKG